jgi:hypothetical protein
MAFVSSEHHPVSSLPHRFQTTPLRRIWLTVVVGAAVPAIVWAIQRRVRNPSRTVLMATIGLGGALALLRDPSLGLYLVVLTSLVVPISFGTGTTVRLNAAMLSVPAVAVFLVASQLLRGRLRLAPSRINRPVLLFLLSSLLSLWIGLVLWDPLVPRPDNILYVQLGQWAIFAVAGAAILLTANLVQHETTLRRLVALFLVLGGGLSILRLLPPGVSVVFYRVGTEALNRPPFWMLLTALAGGQLLYNRSIKLGLRLLLVAVLAANLVYAFRDTKESASGWVALATVLGVLAWFRFRRLRWVVAVILFALLITGVLTQALWQYAGGEKEWITSGGSRVVLMKRVIQVAMRNPITGLGPAAYRAYAALQPLAYGNAFWITPAVNSHNNYVDLFAHTGLVGLGLFLWLMAELAALALRLRIEVHGGFLSGYVHAMLAAGVGSLVLMLLADWMLPHVYNIGFSGFQAAIPVWLFLGGLPAVEHLLRREVDE